MSANELMPTPKEGEDFVLDGVRYFWSVDDDDPEHPPQPMWEADIRVTGGVGIWLQRAGDKWVVREDLPDTTIVNHAQADHSHEVLPELARCVGQVVSEFARWKESWAS